MRHAFKCCAGAGHEYNSNVEINQSDRGRADRGEIPSIHCPGTPERGRANMKLSFGNDFLWGAATAAFQIEGSVAAGGRGESIWDRFCTVPRAIKDGSDGGQACEHYRL